MRQLKLSLAALILLWATAAQFPDIPTRYEGMLHGGSTTAAAAIGENDRSTGQNSQFRVSSYRMHTLTSTENLYNISREIIVDAGNKVPQESDVEEVMQMTAEANGYGEISVFWDFVLTKGSGYSFKVPVLYPQTSKLNSIAYLAKNGRVLKILPCTGNGKPGTIVLDSWLSKLTSTSAVGTIYYIPDSYLNSFTNEKKVPPVVTKLIYHNLGPDKEYLGIKVRENIYEGTDQVQSYYFHEVRLDDTSAQYLLDVNAGSSPWPDRTNIEFTETKDPGRFEDYFAKPAKLFGDW